MARFEYERPIIHKTLLALSKSKLRLSCTMLLLFRIRL